MALQMARTVAKQIHSDQCDEFQIQIQMLSVVCILQDVNKKKTVRNVTKNKVNFVI